MGQWRDGDGTVEGWRWDSGGMVEGLWKDDKRGIVEEGLWKDGGGFVKGWWRRVWWRRVCGKMVEEG